MSQEQVKRLVLDLETKRSFDEVGGAHNKAQLGVSVVGVYSYEDDRFVAYREDRFGELETSAQRGRANRRL